MFRGIKSCFYAHLNIRKSPVIKRFEAWFPLDVTATAGIPGLGCWLTVEHVLHGPAKVGPGRGGAATGARIVKLPGVGQFAVGVEEVEIRGAGSGIGFGDFLALIVEVGEGPAADLAELDHVFWGIGWIILNVVGADSDESHVLFGKLSRDFSELTGQVDNKRAVIADKCDDETFASLNQAGIADGVAFAVREGKFRRRLSGFEMKSGGNFGHVRKWITEFQIGLQNLSSLS